MLYSFLIPDIESNNQRKWIITIYTYDEQILEKKRKILETRNVFNLVLDRSLQDFAIYLPLCLRILMPRLDFVSMSPRPNLRLGHYILNDGY